MKLGTTVTNPGELNKKIVIKSVATSQDADGDTSYAYTTVFMPWARVRTPFGREMVEGFVNQVEVPLEVRIRYDSRVNEKLVVLIDNVLYDIRNLKDIDLKHEYMDFFAAVRKAG